MIELIASNGEARQSAGEHLSQRGIEQTESRTTSHNCQRNFGLIHGGRFDKNRGAYEQRLLSRIR